MKKTLQTITALAMMAGSIATANAQSPTITSASLPKVGDKQVTYSADTVGIMPGPAGANQTWDFTNLKSKNDSIITNVVNPASTPYASDYPAATAASNSASGQAIIYMNLTGGKVELLGYVTSAGSQVVKQKYTNSFIQHTTPMSFNYTHNDNYSGMYTMSPFTVYTRGTISVVADAYGTVRMPNGKIYNNVLRIHANQVNVDSMDVGFGAQIIKTTSESYSFVQQGRMEPVLVITYSSQQSQAGTVASKSVTFNNTSANVSGIEGQNHSFNASSFSVFPNPSASRIINVSMMQENPGAVYINVLNQLGQLVKSFSNVVSAAGTNNVTIGLEELPKGIYLVQVQSNSGASIQKLILE